MNITSLDPIIQEAATVGGLASTYEAGPLPFLALGLLPVRIGRFRVVPLLGLSLGLHSPAPGSDQRDSNCATREPGGFGMSSRQITRRGCDPPSSQGEFDESRKRGKCPHRALGACQHWRTTALPHELARVRWSDGETTKALGFRPAGYPAADSAGSKGKGDTRFPTRWRQVEARQPSHFCHQRSKCAHNVY